MNVFTKLAVGGLLLIGCAKAKDGGARPEAQGSASGSAAVATEQTAPANGGAEGGVVEAKKPLSEYLGAAVSAAVYEVKLGAAGAERNKVATLDEAATKAYLGSLDLSQRADGPVAKCPSDKHVELADAKGQALGTIGFCEGKAAVFILPGGVTVGGINATAP